MNKKKDINESPGYIKWLVLALILLSCFFAFKGSLDNGFVNWDDDVYVQNNSYLNKWTEKISPIFSSEIADNYHPLTIISLAMDADGKKRIPAPFHRTNLILHLLVCIIVFVFTNQLARGNLWVSGFTTLFFAIHPMHVESVAWISERKDLLYSLFFLAGLLAYLRYLSSEKISWLGITFLLFLLSCFSKPAAVVFPLVLLLVDYFVRRKWELRLAYEKIPFFILSIVFGIVTILIQRESAIGELTDFNLLERLLLSSTAFITYLTKLFVPTHLSALHPFPAANAIGALNWIALIACLLFIATAFYSLRKGRLLAFGLGFFAVNVLLVLQFVAVGNALYAERYTYLAYWGLLFLLFTFLFGKKENGEPGYSFTEKIKPVYIGIPLLFIAGFFAYLTTERVPVWKNGATLWTDVVEKYPENELGYTKRGLYYNGKSQFARATRDFNRAIERNENYYGSYAGRGVALMKQKEYEPAIKDFDRAISLNPNYNQVYHNRGTILYEQGTTANDRSDPAEARRLFELALKDYNEALKLDSGYALSYNNRAIIHHLLGHFDEALNDYNRALELDPDYKSAKGNRDVLLRQMESEAG